MNKWLQISIWAVVLVLIAVLLAFINNQRAVMVFHKPIINIDYETENRFVDEKDVLNQIINPNDSIPLLGNAINVNHLEEKIKNNPAIKDAEVYKTIDGNLMLEVKQRRPIVRISPKNNTGYYIDENGLLMPLSNKYTSRVLVVNGFLNEPFAKRYRFNFAHLNDSIIDKTLLDDVYKISKFIDQSDFWKAQIEQIYVNKELDFELIPKVGNHKIVLGGVRNLEAKFKKLMIFYKKGLNKTGWNEYSTINLKYKNQVVCTKMYN